MIKLTDKDKTLVIPSGLGNFGQSSEGGGVTPAEVEEIASAVTAEALDEYDTEIQVDLEELREAVSGSAKDFVVDWAYLRSMDLQGRREYFDVLQEKFEEGYNIYAVGKTHAGGYDVKMPLIEFRKKEGNVAGWARFAGFSTKDITGVTSGYNIIYSSYNSNGYTYPDNPYLDRELSFDTTIYLQLSEVEAMTQSERIALFDDIFAKVSEGYKACMIGLVQGENTRTAVLPLVSYRPETEPALHSGGSLYFAAKGDTDNIYFHVSLSSEGSIEPASGSLIKRNIYNLPTASAEVKGGIKIGSGFTMSQDTLSVDGSGFATKTELSAVTENIGALSGDVETNALAIANLENNVVPELQGAITEVGQIADSANTKVEALSAVTSALTQTVAGKQDALTAGNGIDLSGSTISVKIGDGLGFSGDTLVVSGISSEQNYVIVDSLSEITDPYEGLEAYVKEYTERVVYTGWTIDASQIEEDYVAHIYADGQNETPVYHNSGGFHWDWDNDANGELRKRGDYYYTINGDHTVFSVFFANPDAYMTFEEGVTTATTSTTISVLHKATTYRYNGTSWEEYQPPKVFYLDRMSQADRAALYSEIYQYSELTFPAGNYRFFVTNEGNDEYQGAFEVFVARFYGDEPVSFSGSMQSRYSPTILQRGYAINSDGDFNQTFTESLDSESLANDFQIRINSNGYIASDMLDKFGSLAKFNRFVFVYQDENIQNNYCAAPLKYFYRKNETINGEDKLVEYIGVEININGTWYKGDWHFAEYEWSEWNAPDTWTTI